MLYVFPVDGYHPELTVVHMPVSAVPRRLSAALDPLLFASPVGPAILIDAIIAPVVLLLIWLSFVLAEYAAFIFFFFLRNKSNIQTF